MSETALSISLVPSTVRLQGFSSSNNNNSNNNNDINSPSNQKEEIIFTNPGINDKNSGRFFRPAKNSHKRRKQQQRRQQQQQQQQQQAYDPWKDIYQRNKFENNNQNRRTDIGSEDYVYYDGIPVGAEYLYYGYEDDEEQEQQENHSKTPISRADTNLKNNHQQNNKWPYAFEEPLKEPIKKDPFGGPSVQQQQQLQPQPSLTRRVADAVFSPVAAGVATVVGVPLLLAAAYWLFVENGPTPVVRAKKSLEFVEEEFMMRLAQAAEMVLETIMKKS